MNITIDNYYSLKPKNNPHDEALRLSLYFLPRPANTILIDPDNLSLGYLPSKWGFNVWTAPYEDFKKWLNQRNKTSPSVFWFLIRTMALRFPEKHTEIKNGLAPRRKIEFEFILSQMKPELDWIGLVSLQNNVMLNGDLTNKKVKLVQRKDKSFKIMRR